MTDSMKCPFCGEELEYDWYEYENGRGDTEYAKSGLLKCPDWDCRGYKLKLEPEIWQALIDGKKAQDSLKEISRLNQYIRKELAHQIPEEASKADNSIYTITFEIAKECKKGLHNKIEEKSDDR